MIKRLTVVAAIASTLMASSALADTFTGMGTFGYQRHRGDVDIFSFGGDLNYSFDNSFNLQVSGGDRHLDTTGISGDLTTLKGDGFFRNTDGVLGASFAQHWLSAGASFGGFTAAASTDVQSYGAFAEWYGSDAFTLQLKGGGFSGATDGGYFGVGGKLYVLPDLSLNADYSYVKPNAASNINQINVGAEYLPFAGTPLTVGAAYTYLEGGGAVSNAFGFTLKYRFGTASGSSLANWDRSGPQQWTGQLPILGDLH